VTARAVGRDQVALLAAQSRVRAVVRRVVWRDFAQVASPELIERVCQAVFKELRLCCSDCARPEPDPKCGCR
jgi:hypothetical protein